MTTYWFGYWAGCLICVLVAECAKVHCSPFLFLGQGGGGIHSTTKYGSDEEIKKCKLVSHFPEKEGLKLLSHLSLTFIIHALGYMQFS